MQVPVQCARVQPRHAAALLHQGVPVHRQAGARLPARHRWAAVLIPVQREAVLRQPGLPAEAAATVHPAPHRPTVHRAVLHHLPVLPAVHHTAAAATVLPAAARVPAVIQGAVPPLPLQGDLTAADLPIHPAVLHLRTPAAVADADKLSES